MAGAEAGTREHSERLIGREAELARLDSFLDGDRRSGALLLSGAPGVGKTTLWEAGLDGARGRGLRVLSARPSGAEAQLSFAALTDLLENVDVTSLPGVPAPQRQALEVALLRAEPAGPRLEPRAIAMGLLNALRELAAAEPLVVAVDDLQWLDRPSAEALSFAARRFDGHDVRFLVAKRSESSPPFEDALPSELERIGIEPLSLGAIRRLLYERLDLSLPRRVLRQLFDSSGGNPLFALELGRTLAARGIPGIGEEILVPDAAEDQIGVRVAKLARPLRRLLLAAALSPDLSPPQLRAVVDPDAVEQAVDDGLVVVEGDRVRPSHPLLAAAARKRSRPRERRELHLALAVVVESDELRARHLALSAEEPHETLAATIATAAAGASARGAAQEAVVLGEHALRLTPSGSTDRGDRVLALAGYLLNAGETHRVPELLTPELDSLPPGAARVHAWRLLCEDAPTFAESEPFNERALAESKVDPALHAYMLAEISCDRAVLRLERIHELEARAREALPLVQGGDPDLERHVLQGLAWARSFLGQPVDDVCERFRAVSDAAFPISAGPERVASERLIWRGEIGRARADVTALLRAADERGEPLSYELQRLHLLLLELRIGNWQAASLLLDEWAESTGELLAPMYPRCCALLAAGRGLPAEAERWAAEALAKAEAMGVRWDELEALRARGIASLLAHEHAAAAVSLRAVWEHLEREGVEEPGAVPVAPDLVEVLVELGEMDEAAVVTERLSVLAQQQEHPWGLATTKLCRGLQQLSADAYVEGAAALLEAAADYERLGLRFDQARALLALGRGERRLRKWGAARRTLEQAASLFDEIGSTGWAEEARSELSRVGARKPQPEGELTRTEARVAGLAADGLSNKEIASTLFVTVHTVEVHLSHAYAKLGIRSRSQLARRLAARP